MCKKTKLIQKKVIKNAITAAVIISGVSVTLKIFDKSRLGKILEENIIRMLAVHYADAHDLAFYNVVLTIDEISGKNS